jgi:hypothetical protein
MATMTLTPDGLAASPGWAANTGTINAALVANDGDTTYAEAGTNTETCTLTFSAPSVAEGDIASITSVQFLTYGRFPARGSGGTNVDFLYEIGASSGLGETINYPNSAVYGSRDGTVRTVNIAGSAWSYGNLEDIELKLTKNGASSPDVRITMVTLLVTYEEAAAADNAIFFGTNF